MFTKKLIMVVIAIGFLAGHQLPVSHGQSGPSFVGVWRLTIQFSPQLSPFDYAVVARPSPGFKPDDFGPVPDDKFGEGLVIGPCFAAKASGLTWRHTPRIGSPATGVSLTFEVTSATSPSTIVIRGNFSPDGNRIVGGKCIVISDNTEASQVQPGQVFDDKIGQVVTLVPFTLERVRSMSCGGVDVP